MTTIAGTLGTSGTADGDGGAARFNRPFRLVIDAAGNLFVSDNFNQTVRKITPGGTVSTLAGAPTVPGVVDGGGSAARFNKIGRAHV